MTNQNPIIASPWKKLLLSAFAAVAATALMDPARAIDTNFTQTSNLTVLNGGASNVSAGVVVGNSAGGNTANITTTANNTVLGWVNYGNGVEPIASSDSINYTVPNGSSILNTVSGGGASTIDGLITSNGKVFVLNPAGITINGTAVLRTTGGFYASTIPESISYFIANGTLQAFSATPSATTTSGPVTANLAGTNVPWALTAANNGNIGLAGNGVTVSGGAVNGSLQIISTGSAVALGTSAALAVGNASTTGNLTITTEGGSTTLSGAAITSVSGTTTIDTVTGAVASGATVSQGAGAFTTNGFVLNGGSTTTVNLPVATNAFGNNKAITVTAGNTTLAASDSIFLIGTSSITGTATLTASNNLTLGNLTVTDNNTAAPVALSVSGKNVAMTSGASLNVTGTTNSSAPQVAITGSSNNDTLIATGNLNISALPATLVSLSLTSTGNLTLPASAETIPTVTLNSGGTITATGFSVSANNQNSNSVTITSAGTIGLPTLTFNSGTGKNVLSVTATAGDITQNVGTALSMTSNNVGSLATFKDTAGAVVLTNAGNTFAGAGPSLTPVIITGAPNGSSLASSGALVLSGGTNITGAASYTAGGAITIGNLANDSLTFANTLNIKTTSGTISTAATNINANGAVTLTTSGGAISLGNSSLIGPGTNYTYGQVSADTTNGGASAAQPVSISENSTTNLGAVTATTLNVTSTNGNIINSSGQVTATTANVSAGSSLLTPGSVTIGTANAAKLDVLNVNNASSVSLAAVPNATTSVAVNAVNALNSLALATNNANNLLTSGNITNVAVALGTGTATVNDSGNVTLGNSTSGAASNVVVNATNGSTITLGSGIALGGTATFQATGSTSTITANITDTPASPVQVFGATEFVTDGTINVANNTANNFGAVTLVVNGNGAINYTEGGTVNLAGIDGYSGLGPVVLAPYTGVGNIAITSANGSIIQSGAFNQSNASGGTVTLSAAKGAVTLTNAANVFNGAVSVTAGADSAMVNNSAAATLSLGNVYVPLNAFSYTTSQGGTSIKQTTGSSIFVYGNSSFNATGAGTISLTNSGNNFGQLTLTSGSGNIAVTESGTSNFNTVTTTGSLTSVSQNGGIIEASGTAGITSKGGSFAISGAGNAITLNNPLNNFGGTSGGAVKLVALAGENATLWDSNATTSLADGTSIPANLTVNNVSTAATVVIQDSGNTNGTVTVGGLLSLNALNAATVSTINFSGSNNSIASLAFKDVGTSGSSVFTDGTNLTLAGPTTSAGNLTIIANGVASTGSTPATFAGNVNITAQIGSIILTNTNLFFTKQVTVSGAVSTDLSALSLSNNFNNIAPINLGKNYKAPQP